MNSYTLKLYASLLLIVVLLPNFAFTQSSIKKAEQQADECLEEFFNSKGVKWLEIQDYFEHWIEQAKIPRESVSKEMGYLYFLYYAMDKEEFPSLAGEPEFEEKLTKLDLLDADYEKISSLISPCFFEANNLYKSKFPEYSKFQDLIALFTTIRDVGDISPLIVNNALMFVLEEEYLINPIYKKVLVLYSFIPTVFGATETIEEIMDQKEITERQVVPEDERGEELVFEIVEVEEPVRKEGPYYYPDYDNEAEFPGGKEKLDKFISENIIYPSVLKGENITGNETIQFCVLKNGKIGRVMMSSGFSDPLLTKEVLRLVRSFPKWIPGEKDGEKVSTWNFITIEFTPNSMEVKENFNAGVELFSEDESDAMNPDLKTYSVPIPLPPPPPPPPPPTGNDNFEDYESEDNVDEDNVDEDNESGIYWFAEIMPEFSGGDSVMRAYLVENINISKVAIEYEIHGRVFVRFIVRKSGEITDVEVVRGIEPVLDQEAARVVESMPDWKPGMNNGVAVDVQLILPIAFNLE